MDLWMNKLKRINRHMSSARQVNKANENTTLIEEMLKQVSELKLAMTCQSTCKSG